MVSELMVLDSKNIQDRILQIRGLQVMLDRDLAQFYQIETRALKQAVKRNSKRFPKDFMFVLDEPEIGGLVSQSVIPSKKSLGGAQPFVFTEQGVASLSSILTSDRAIQINIAIMRAFVEMRHFLAENGGLVQRIDSLEKRQLTQEIKTDERFLKDLGKRWFAFSKIERDSLAVMGRVEEVLGYGG